MRRFELHRDVDASGISGTGIVAQGVQFSTGDCALGWLTAVRSVAVYRCIEDVEAIHGHAGATRLVWLDPALTQPMSQSVSPSGRVSTIVYNDPRRRK